MRLESHVVHLIHGAGLGNVDPVVHRWRNHILVNKVTRPHPGIVSGVVKVVWYIAGIGGATNKFIIVAIVSSIGVIGKVCAHPKGVHGIVVLLSITSIVG